MERIEKSVDEVRFRIPVFFLEILGIYDRLKVIVAEGNLVAEQFSGMLLCILQLFYGLIKHREGNGMGDDVMGVSRFIQVLCPNDGVVWRKGTCCKKGGKAFALRDDSRVMDTDDGGDLQGVLHPELFQLFELVRKFLEMGEIDVLFFPDVLQCGA